MKTLHPALILALCASLHALMPARADAAPQAGVAWDEAVTGDLSNSGLAPTPVTFAAGANTVRGTTGRVNGVVDRDYLRFEVPAGWQLDTLTLLPGSSFLGISGLGFIAIQAGPQLTVNPTGGSPAGLLGWVHYSVNDIGTDILGLMGIGAGAIGFAGALPEGTYSIWVQDTGSGVASYGFSYALSPVPEPPPGALWLAGFGAVATFGRRLGRLHRFGRSVQALQPLRRGHRQRQAQPA